MIVEQFYLSCLAHASYLIADEESKKAVVIDPRRDIDDYLSFAKDRDVEIEHVVLTHFHADFVAGHLELQKATGASIHMGARAKPDYEISPMKTGDFIELGKLRLGVMETPGHTPEGICLLLFDSQKSAKNPHAVFTGDTLFVGDVGRPDLLASVGMSAEQLAGALYDSLQILLALPDEVLVYPAHGAGSLCGKNLGKETYSTIGVQRASNPALQEMTKEAFITLVTSEQPKAPKYFAHDVQLNKSQRATLAENLEAQLKPLDITEIIELQKIGVLTLDLRSAEEFAKSHLTKSLNFGLDGKFAPWIGAVLDAKTPMTIITDEGREREAITRLGRIGFSKVIGYLAGGAKSLLDEPQHLSKLQGATPSQVSAELINKETLFLLDVRSEREAAKQHIANSHNIPLSELTERIDEIPKDKLCIVHCAGGYRSSTAASLLRAEGFEVVDMLGGMAAWTKAGLETVDSNEACQL